MVRFLSFASAIAVVAAAVSLYALKLETRQIEADVQALERSIEKAEGDIAALKAERAWLGRPERIEALARAQGMVPIRPEQYARGVRPVARTNP